MALVVAVVVAVVAEGISGKSHSRLQAHVEETVAQLPAAPKTEVDKVEPSQVEVSGEDTVELEVEVEEEPTKDVTEKKPTRQEGSKTREKKEGEFDGCKTGGLYFPALPA